MRHRATQARAGQAWHHTAIAGTYGTHHLLIVHSIHVTENLQHHKASDVRRILEEKGFTEDGATEEDGATHFYPVAGTPQSSKQTKILFDDGDFVMEEGGVTHTE